MQYVGRKGTKLEQAFYEEPARNYEDLKKQFDRLRKGANDRMYELEQSATKDEYKGVLGYAYAKAQKDIESWGGKNATRFGKAEKNYNALLGQVNDLKRFLSMPSSTTAGIKEIYQKRTNTINRKYGTDFTWQELAKFFDSGLGDKLQNYGSKTAFKAIGEMQKNKDKIIADIEASKDAHVQVDNKHLQATVNKMLKTYGDDVANFLKEE